MKKIHKFSIPIQASWYPWAVWGLAASAFLLEYFVRVSPGVMVDQLMSALKVQALSLSGISAFFYYAYVSMQLPVGLLVDRFSPGRLLATMTFVCALGCLLFSIATTPSVAASARFIMGLGASFAFISALKLAAQWFPSNQWGLLAGLTQALGMLGACSAQAPLAYLINAWGWRPTLGAFALLIALLALGIGVWIKDKASEQLKPSIRFVESLKCILSNPQNWWNALFAGLLYAPTMVLAELWGVKFYREVYGFSNEIAAFAISMIFMGWTLGGPIAGWLSDRLKQRRYVLQLSASLSLISLLIALFVPGLPMMGLIITLFIYGIANTGVAISYAVAAESNNPCYAGTSIAFTNMTSVLIGAIFQPIIGGLLDYSWDFQFNNGVPVYTAQAFKTAMLSLPICLLLAWIISSFKIKESWRSERSSSTQTRR